MTAKNLNVISVGVRLKHIREMMGLSLAQAAELSVTMRNTRQLERSFKAVVLGSYERTDREMPLGRVYDLAVLYDVSVEWLMTGAETPETAVSGLVARLLELRDIAMAMAFSLAPQSCLDRPPTII
jgi:transcriptional regulator with XRE-family HTH domain